MSAAAANALLESAEAALARRELEAAAVAFHHAEEQGAPPDRCSSGRWLAAMLTGNLQAAWHESDAIRVRNAPDPHRFWNGEALPGKRVLVRCLHGFGDAVQMLRYVPLLARHASELIFELPPRMVPLASCFSGLQNVITWGEDAPSVPPAYDLQVEIMELPYIFRTETHHLPLASTYLEVPHEAREKAATAMGHANCPRIGIIWAGGEWNPHRSIPFPTLAPLLDLAGFEFWNLQGGPASAEARGTTMRDATSICGDGLLALAATIANLDLVITVDTLAAHLAGALGKPAWVMLQYAADWRWMTSRCDSPWYPTMRLFRQPAPDDWQSVVRQVCNELAPHH